MTDAHGMAPTLFLPCIPHSPEACAAMGAVWANTLHNVYTALVDAFGWTRSATVDPDAPEGNVVFFHLLFDALLLRPCNPTCELFSLAPYSAVFSHVDTDTEWTVLDARDT